MRTEEYLHILTDQVRCKMARDEIQDEIRGHIEDQTAAYLSEGMEPDQAEEMAVREMGDPVEVGQDMDRIHRPKMAWGMIALITILSIAGYVLRQIMYAITRSIENSMPVDLSAPGISSGWYTRFELPMLLLGLALMIGICYVDYTRIAKRARELMVGYLILILLGISFLGGSVNGARRWIVVGGLFTMNIVNLLWLTVPLFAAILYRYRGESYKALGKGILWMLAVEWIILHFGGDFASAYILFLVYNTVIVAAVYKGWFQIRKKSILFGIGGITLLSPIWLTGFLLVVGKAYQKDRILAFLGMGENISYQLEICRKMLSGSSAFDGNPEFNELLTMAPSSSHLLTCVIASYGILAGVLLAVLLVVLFLRFARISLQQRNQLGMVMGTGCTMLFLIQVVVFIAENTGIITGFDTYCPFLGTGRSGMLASYILLGILLSIYRYQNMAPERKFRYEKEQTHSSTSFSK